MSTEHNTQIPLIPINPDEKSQPEKEPKTEPEPKNPDKKPEPQPVGSVRKRN